MPPTFFIISLVTVSPVKAANLALSKLSCFPVNNSASNSADIDCSKFNNCLPAFATSLRDIPNDLAVATDLTNISKLPPDWALLTS